MASRSQTTTPPSFGWIWAAAALPAAAALAAQYGFREPLFSPPILRILFIAALVVFVASRVVLFFPGSEVAGRLQRWWVDYLLIVAGGIWWAIDPSREPVIERVGAIYILALGAGAAGWTVMDLLLERIGAGRPLTWRLILALSLTALAGGLVLSLPVCWASPVTGQKLAQHAMHLLNCVFTAVSAITCTGLTPLDVAQDFTLPGHLTILVLMQLGALAVVMVGTALGVRWREARGNGSTAREEIVRILRWGVAMMVGVELLGAAMLYPMWDASRDAAFAATSLPSMGRVDTARVLFSLFHAVSAFCNGGLSLVRDGLTGYAWQWQIYAALLPLMVLGSVGAPVLHELSTRWRRPGGEPLAYATRVTLWGSLLLVIAGAGMLLAIESTHGLQLRYPRESTPGRLQVAGPASQDAATTGDSTRSPARLAVLDVPRRAAVSLFESAAARSSGFKLVRMDESSIAPASRWVLMLLMLVGGGVGGTAGGVRILTAWLCVRAVFRPGTAGERLPWRAPAALLLLTGAVSFVLLYRDVGSFEASLFEALSATCNVGLTTGLTRQLFVEAKIALIVAMLLGRAIPLGMLMAVTPASGTSRPASPRS